MIYSLIVFIIDTLLLFSSASVSPFHHINTSVGKKPPNENFENFPLSIIGDPIRCWVPAQLRDNYEDYIDRLCYIQNTYHIAKGKIVPQDVQYRRERTLKYYQWIHFVLLLQAFFFLFPRILWQSFNNQIGLPIANLVDASYQYRLFNFDQNRDASQSSFSFYFPFIHLLF